MRKANLRGSRGQVAHRLERLGGERSDLVGHGPTGPAGEGQDGDDHPGDDPDHDDDAGAAAWTRPLCDPDVDSLGSKLPIAKRDGDEEQHPLHDPARGAVERAGGDRIGRGGASALEEANGHGQRGRRAAHQPGERVGVFQGDHRAGRGRRRTPTPTNPHASTTGGSREMTKTAATQPQAAPLSVSIDAGHVGQHADDGPQPDDRARRP